MENAEISPNSENSDEGVREDKDNHSISVEIQLENIIELLDELKLESVSRLELDRFKDESIKKLSDSNQQLSGDFRLSVRQDLVKEIFIIHDSVYKMQQKFLHTGIKEVNHEIEILLEDIEEILSRNNIEKIGLSTDDVYNREFQKVVSKVETPLESENGKISRIVRNGFESNGTIIRKQEIELKSFN